MVELAPTYLTVEDLILRWDPKILAEILGDPTSDATVGAGQTVARLAAYIQDAASDMAPWINKLRGSGYAIVDADNALQKFNLVGANYYIYKYNKYIDRGPEGSRLNPWFGEWMFVLQSLSTGQGLNITLDGVQMAPGGLLNTTAEEEFRTRRDYYDGRDSGIDLSREF